MTATLEPGRSLEELAADLDRVMTEIQALAPEPREVATQAVDRLNELHRQALITVVRRLREDPRGKELLFELVDDPAVHMVLALHGIVRPDPSTTAQRVLDQVRPGLQSHGGDVELVEVRDGAAYVRLSGACNGCSMAAVTMRESVEAALIAGVPGVASVEVVPNDPEPTLIPLTSIGIGVPDDGAHDHGAHEHGDHEHGPAETGWFQTFPVERVEPGSLEAVSLRPADGGESIEAIVVNAGGRLSAYINACAHQGLPLDNALVDATEGTVTCPWHGFCYDAVEGECLTMPGARLEQLPLRVDDGHIWIRATGS